MPFRQQTGVLACSSRLSRGTTGRSMRNCYLVRPFVLDIFLLVMNFSVLFVTVVCLLAYCTCSVRQCIIFMRYAC